MDTINKSTYRSFATTVSQLKIWDFSGEILKVLKCYNFLWVQRRHNCSPAASFANCVMTLYLLKVHLQTFLSIPITQKCQILSCDTLVANERYKGLVFSRTAVTFVSVVLKVAYLTFCDIISEVRCIVMLKKYSFSRLRSEHNVIIFFKHGVCWKEYVRSSWPTSGLV